MSRSSFAARFTDVIGMPPMTYVAVSRMRRAREMLLGGSSVTAVAGALGYGSDAAFSRAFAQDHRTDSRPGPPLRGLTVAPGTGRSPVGEASR